MNFGLNLMSMTELLQHKTVNPPDYLVDNLIAAGTFNLIVAKPKVGKSTFARQLVAAVLKGSTFLDRKVQQGDVVYLSCEERKSVICSAMERHGVGAEHGFYVSTDNAGTPATFITNLRLVLQQLPNLKLIVMDTLGDYLQAVNLDDYSTVNPLVKQFVALAQDHNITIVAVYHSRKRAGASAGDTVMGSTAITGAADTAIYLSGEALGVRTFKTISRECEMVPATKLFFDESTRSFSIGEKVKSQREKRTVATEDMHRSSILANITETPISQKKLLAAVGGTAASVIKMIEHLVDQGDILREGKGRRGSEYSYRIADAGDNGNWGAVIQ